MVLLLRPLHIVIGKARVRKQALDRKRGHQGVVLTTKGVRVADIGPALLEHPRTVMIGLHVLGHDRHERLRLVRRHRLAVLGRLQYDPAAVGAADPDGRVVIGRDIEPDDIVLGQEERWRIEHQPEPPALLEALQLALGMRPDSVRITRIMKPYKQDVIRGLCLDLEVEQDTPHVGLARHGRGNEVRAPEEARLHPAVVTFLRHAVAVIHRAVPQ